MTDVTLEQNTKKDAKVLFNRGYQLEQELITLKEDLKELADEFTYHKEFCTNGLPKTEVKKILRAARAKANQDNLKEKIEELEEIEEIQNRYS